MVSRTLGVLLLLRWLAPVLIGAAVVLIFYQVFVDARQAAQNRVPAIEESAKNLKELVSDTQAQLKQIESDAQQIGQAVGRLTDVDFEIPVSLSLPPIQVPPVELRVPKVTVDTRPIELPLLPSFDVPTVQVTTEIAKFSFPEIEGLSIPLPELFPAIQKILADLQTIVVSISDTLKRASGIAATLSSAKQDLQEIQEETLALKTETLDIFQTWGTALFWLLLASFVIVILSYIATTIDGLRHSWRLITGKGG